MTTQFKDHFSQQSASYSRNRPHYPAELYDYLLQNSSGRDLAWDCATGNGQVAAVLAEHFHKVIATDGSPAQLAHAIQGKNISYINALAEESGLDDSSVDLLTVGQALHWFRFEAFYAEARRVLKPGGLLAAWTYTSFCIGANLDSTLRDFYESIVGAWWPPERRLVDDGYRYIPFPLQELPSPVFNLTQHWSFERMLGYLDSWSATKNYVAAHGIDPVATHRAQLAEMWGDPEATQEITMPVVMRAGRF